MGSDCQEVTLVQHRSEEHKKKPWGNDLSEVYDGLEAVMQPNLATLTTLRSGTGNQTKIMNTLDLLVDLLPAFLDSNHRVASIVEHQLEAL